MHWILQENIFHEDAWDRIVETLERLDLPYSVHKVVPFVGEILPDIDPDGPVVCMGSYALRHLAKSRNWNPGVWDIAEEDFFIQRMCWGSHMLNYTADVVEFGIAQFWDDVDEMFIRPIDDTKVFPGQLFRRSEFEAWQKRVCELNLHDNGSELASDQLIMLCAPQTIWSEYRFWVVKGQIVTSSLYKIGNRVRYELGAPEPVTRFVESRIADWQPHEAFVIDVAVTPDGLKVIEINTLNSSGYYAGDVQKLIFAIEEAFG